MAKIVPVVEGDGELRAVPTLLGKVLTFLNAEGFFPGQPKNAHGRGNLTKPGGIELFVTYALRERDCGGVLVLLDADADCPHTLACQLAERVRLIAPVRPVVVVVANRSYENWFVATIDALTVAPIEGRLSLREPPVRPINPEDVTNAKNWLTKLMGAGRVYKETIDQHPMTQLLDIPTVHASSRSFRRFVHAVEQLVQTVEGDPAPVTPVCA